MMKPFRACGANIHSGASAHGLETLQNTDVLCAITALFLVFFFGHLPLYYSTNLKFLPIKKRLDLPLENIAEGATSVTPSSRSALLQRRILARLLQGIESVSKS